MDRAVIDVFLLIAGLGFHLGASGFALLSIPMWLKRRENTATVFVWTKVFVFSLLALGGVAGTFLAMMQYLLWFPGREVLIGSAGLLGIGTSIGRSYVIYKFRSE